MRQQLGFGALIVSDAMWMGDYERMSLTQMLPVYLNSFVSGMDILMIKGNHFAGAVDFFRRIYDNEVTNDEIKAIEARTKQNYSEIRQKFVARIQESSRRLDIVLNKVGDARAQMGQGAPKDQTTQLRARYNQILMAVDVRWKTILAPTPRSPLVVP